MKRKASLFSNRGAFTLLYTEKENFFKITGPLQRTLPPSHKKGKYGEENIPEQHSKNGIVVQLHCILYRNTELPYPVELCEKENRKQEGQNGQRNIE